ncbi:peritrophin-48 [Drosophila biarmipes]|uniref:peritrophin-48 n=1 Tax=Drosophila biarmipes TaxID=125945 RepID=UPI0007E85813|nr:peritrophin-48 [Drosophila biarmipes]XP_050742408.1 peritrophin-48 [Drosophila biarmipes]XP_050742409.1 peritrophin-48 [Drosophila biarmipes]
MPGLSSSLVLQALLLVLTAHVSTQTRFLNATDDICRLFKDGTKLRKPGSCSEWFECNNSEASESQSCTGTGQYFSLAKNDCYKSIDDSYCSAPSCKGVATGYIGDTRNCANWYYCDSNAVLGSGTCQNGMHFDQVNKRCVYPENTVCAATYELCDIVPSGVLFRDEANCHKYHSCVKNVLKNYTCETGTYFNVATGKCGAKKDIVCDDHPLPEDACGTKKLAMRNKFVSDQATCRGYYYCRDLGSGVPDPDPIHMQCDENTFFNQDRQGCMPRESQKCIYDRCDGRQDGYEVAEDEGCHKYIQCVDGRESTPMSCGEEYFNAATQSCAKTKITYGACSA